MLLGALLALLSTHLTLAADAPASLDLRDLSAPVFDVFDGEDGLSDEIWSTVGFDRDGFVWAGSASELSRFDGYGWTPYDFPATRGLVRDMASDADGGLWAIYEREGLVKWVDGDWQLVGLPKFFQRFSEYVEDGVPRLALADREGIRRLQGGQWVLDPEPLPNEAGQPVELNRTEHLFGGPREWLGVADDHLYFRELSPAGVPGPWQIYPGDSTRRIGINDLLVVGSGDQEALWVISYGGGIIRIGSDGERVWRKGDDGLPSEAIYSAVVSHGADGSETLWIASRGGLLRFIDQRLSVFDRRHGLPSNAVRGLKLQRDSDGTERLWAATEGGVVRASLAANRWQTVSLLGAAENGIFGVLHENVEGSGERLWVGSAQDGLALLADGRWQYFTEANGRLPATGVRALWRVAGPDGTPWRVLSLLGGQLARINDDLSIERLPTPWPAVTADFSNAALTRQHDGAYELWVGNQISGLYRRRDGQWLSIPGTSRAEIGSINGLIEQVDTAGKRWIWVAATKALGRIDGERFEPVAPTSELPAEGYRSLTLLQEGGRQVIWGSTGREGVVRIDVSDPTRPRPADPISLPDTPDPTVYSVLADSVGRIYVCTNNGVQQLIPLADGGYSGTVFRRRNGLVHDECNSHSQQIDSRDRYWVGTLGGLSVFDAAIELQPRRSLPKPLYFTGATVDSGTLALDAEPLRLSAGNRELKIDFTLLSGERERESRYQTQLVGLEDKTGSWSSEPSRVFGALPPGDYQFRIWGVDAGGTESGPKSLTFSVEPLWWQQTWIQIALALVLVLLAVIVAGLYNRGLRLSERRLSRQVKEQTAELRAANLRLTELSYRDPLTGLANRRRLMEAVEPAIRRAREKALPLGLILIDVDHFKDYNDRHGHLAGDAALHAIAKALESATRQQDLVARFGGEEFACLLLDSPPEVVERIGERMRALVEALPPRALGNNTETVTVSAGFLARIPEPGETSSDLFNAADAALYAAKKAGRNRLSFAAAKIAGAESADGTPDGV